MKKLSIEAAHVMDVLYGKISLANKKEDAISPPETWQEKIDRVKRRKEVTQKVADLFFTKYLEASARAENARAEYLKLLSEEIEYENSILKEQIKNGIKRINHEYDLKMQHLNDLE